VSFDHDDPSGLSPEASAPGVTESQGEVVPHAVSNSGKVPAIGASALGSGLLARQPTPDPSTLAAVPKVCPQCGTEYETGSRFCVKDGAPLRPKAGDDPLVGRVIADRYLVLARLGEGGMGRVYLAEHLKINRQCAVKVMNPALVNDHESATRFAREASNAAQILHPNVAAVFDFGESDRTVYLVMEYVDGEPLAGILLKEGALEPRRAVDIACQIADGLTAAHELGIVHRDLKPDNVIVSQTRTGRDTPKIVDFGIAKAASEAPADALTRSGLVIGTPEYMSPEQLLGDPIDARTDVYSLGCILYQMLTGTTPYADESRELMIRRRLHEPPPRLRDLVPGLPRRLDATIAHMLARSPGDRLASAADARAALDPALVFSEWVPQANPVVRAKGAPLKRISGAKRLSGGKRISDEVIDVALQETIQLPKQQERHTVRNAAFGAVMVAALAVAGRELWQMRPVPPPMETLPDTLPHMAIPAPAGVIPSSSAATVAKNTRRDSQRPASRGMVPITLPDSTPSAPLLPTVTEDPLRDPLRRPLEQFRAAMATGDIVAVRNIYPEAPAELANFFGSVENIHAKLQYVGTPAIVDDHADVDFMVILTYDRRKPKTEGNTSRARYHAALHREGGVWRIEKITPRE
jgi:serine/threonine protein kinase